MMQMCFYFFSDVEISTAHLLDGVLFKITASWYVRGLILLLKKIAVCLRARKERFNIAGCFECSHSSNHKGEM